MSKFGFSVIAAVRAPKSSEPIITATPTEGKFKLNQSATILLQVVNGDRVMFLSNVASLRAAGLSEEEVKAQAVYGIAKSVVEKDENGNPLMCAKRLSKKEEKQFAEGTYTGMLDEAGKPVEPKYKGFKLASATKTNELGAVLEGSDIVQWKSLGGDPELNVNFRIVADEYEELEVEGETVKAYMIELESKEPKVVRNRAEANDNSIEEVDDNNIEEE